MRKIQEVLRLALGEQLSLRDVGRSISASPSTVQAYLERAKLVGVSWPLPEGLDEAGLEKLLFPSGQPAGGGQRALPDYAIVHQELRHKGVTLTLLWQEYKACRPDGLEYSQFCERYRQWAGKVNLCMRQHHRAGEKLFVDYAGQTVPVECFPTGRIRQAQIFAAVMGASNYTYAEGTWTQTLPDWIGSHARAFSFFGGVPAVLVPDNLKSGITDACYYEPDVNRTYLELAEHYGCVVIPARTRRPKDKAKVEAGVLLIERWILARLRHRTFHSLGELNTAIRELLTDLNNRPFKKLPGCRRSSFESIDQPALKALPLQPFEYAQWLTVRVNIDYHVEVKRHYYSVPCSLVKCRLDVRLTDHTVECFLKGRRVASHLRDDTVGKYTTLPEHMPQAHREYLGWPPSRLIHWAETIGSATAAMTKHILQTRPHPEQGYRSCLGILRLSKTYGNERLEAACCRALGLQSFSYKSVKSILKSGLDHRPLTPRITSVPIDHSNVRGSQYYESLANADLVQGGAKC
jgi:transposase